MVADVKAACNIAVYVCPSNAISMAAACAVAAIKSGADGVVTSVSGELMSADVFSDIIRTRGADMGVECRLNVAGVHREIDSIKSQMAGKSGSVTVVADSSYTNVSLTADSTLTEVSKAVRALGYELSHEDSGKVFEEFKRVSAKKSKIGIKEIDAIVAAAAMQVPSTYHVESYVINSGNIINATANVILTRDGEKLCGISVGDGPINAAFLAIEQVIGHHYELDDFQIQSVTEGHEAMGSALVKLRDGDKLYSGVGVSTDIIGASIRAYINALNKIVYNAK
jgi:2-isopropylmalate synthase